MAGKKISDETLENVRACVADKKNPQPCIDKVMEEAGIDADKKSELLTKAFKKELD